MRPAPRGITAGMAEWTPEEDECLRAAYSQGGINLAVRALPGRTRLALFHRARRLGLPRRARWTPEDDQRLRYEWGDGVSVPTIAKILGRTPLTVYWRAQKLGLSLGVPDGFEYLSHAAERTGFSTGQLRAILAYSGVRLHLVMGRTSHKWKRRRHHFVDPVLVDDAVAAWMQLETPEQAARRLGICADRLRARLRKIGVGNEPGNRKHIRVTPEQLELANAGAHWHKRTRAAKGAA